jgi:hypothetical protein
MKRVRRKLFYALVTFSLLLCIATIVIRVMSWMENGLGREWVGARYRLVLMTDDAGHFGASLRLGSEDIFGHDAGYGIFFDPSIYSVEIHDPALGDSYSEEIYRIHFPYWIVTVVFATFPATACLAWLARRWIRVKSSSRVRSNLCGSCGYDLRATPDRCPECGAISQKREITSN